MESLADLFGFPLAIGEYTVGLFLKKDAKEDKIYNESKLVMDHIAFSIFDPIFFVNLGSQIVFEFSILTEIYWQILVLFLLVFVLHVLSAALVTRFTGSDK